MNETENTQPAQATETTVDDLERESHSGTLDEAEDLEEATEAEKAPDARLATVLALLTAVVMLAAGCAVWFGVESARLSDGDPSANLALVDTGATAEVTDQVGGAIKAIFSYDYANLDRTERAAENVLADRAVTQYRDSFAVAKKQAMEQNLVRTTTVRAIGVRELTGGTARLLVFLDQQTLKPGGQGQQAASAHLDISARKTDSGWKITEILAL